MPDPFRERNVTLTITSKTNAVYRVGVLESVAIATMNAFWERDLLARTNPITIPHSEGVMVTDLNGIDGINALIQLDAKKDFVANLRS